MIKLRPQMIANVHKIESNMFKQNPTFELHKPNFIRKKVDKSCFSKLKFAIFIAKKLEGQVFIVFLHITINKNYFNKSKNKIGGKTLAICKCIYLSNFLQINHPNIGTVHCFHKFLGHCMLL